MSPHSSHFYYCHRVDPDYNGPQPKPPVVPRYKLSPLPRTVMAQVYGLPVVETEEANVLGTSSNNETKQVAYFSTMGSLDSIAPDDIASHQRVTTVLIVIHGSGRNAEDYLYGAAASLPTDQQDPNNSTVLVLAPWFLDPDDEESVKDQVYWERRNEDIPTSSSTVKSSVDYGIPIPLPPNTLRWIENGPFVSHTWRYGANAINSNISSFAAVDLMVEKLLLLAATNRLPSLQRIVVTGHSAGGQFVQRWALLSNSNVWNLSSLTNNLPSPTGINTNKPGIAIRVVPANPRCFAFLDERRFVVETNGTTSFRRPDDTVISSCPDYNEWIWGLDKGGDVTVPYKDQAIEKAGGAQALARRYVTERHLVYLAGGEDKEIFDDDCGSVIQGQTRLERSHAFMMSLSNVFPQEMTRGKHTRLFVPGVPHDHMLMFQSPQGQEALFGENYDDKEARLQVVDA